MMNQTAQGLASLGRGNDSMLMHVTPNEVAGLQSIAMAHGGSLTINPHTGLPEAGFLDSFLPMVAGFGLNAAFPGLGALGSGLLVGGVTALASGDLGKGVMAGLGAGSGAGLGNIFTKMGTQSVGGIPVGAAQDAVKSAAIQELPANVAQNAATNLGMFNAPGATATMGGVGATVPNAFQSLSNISSNIGPGVNSSVNAMGAAPSSAQIAQSQLSQPSFLGGVGERLQSAGRGFGDLISDPLGEGFEKFKVAGGEGGKDLTTGQAAFKLGSPIASLALSSMEPEPYKGYEDPDKGKYRGPEGQLNLSDKYSTGLRLAEGGTITTGGIRDLYGSSDNQTMSAPSIDGYGLGRLSNLANEQAMTTAKSLGYADGGDVSGSPSADVAAEVTKSGIDPALIYGDMVDDKTRLPYVYDRILTPGALDARRISPIEYNPYTYASALRKQEGMAKGGYLDGAGDGMSDSIPATIEGKQPARLADGEFVVPADVVSHIGNGSSKAGSQRLYSMLDKVRKARTGHTKQGKQIKPEKYMPA